MFNSVRSENVLKEVLKERKRQHKIYGEQNHKPSEWLSVLLEEIGEIGSAIRNGDKDNYRVEVIQSAAVLIQMVECLDRNYNFKRCPNV